MPLFRIVLKTSFFVLTTLLLSPIYLFILVMCYPWRRAIGPKIVQRYARICLVIFRVRIMEVKNYEFFQRLRGGVIIVSNHSSFLDIFVLSSIFGAAFVSKADVKYYPIIGQIASLMGVIFLNRDSQRERVKMIKTIAHSCSDRILVVFPQGTTGRITDRLPFNRGIFKVIELNPDLSLLPVTISYQEDTEIAWHKPQSLWENMMKVSAQERISVTVTVHKPICIDDYRGKTSAEVCSTVEQIVLHPHEA